MKNKVLTGRFKQGTIIPGVCARAGERENKIVTGVQINKIKKTSKP